MGFLRHGRKAKIREILGYYNHKTSAATNALPEDLWGLNTNEWVVMVKIMKTLSLHLKIFMTARCCEAGSPTEITFDLLFFSSQKQCQYVFKYIVWIVEDGYLGKYQRWFFLCLCLIDRSWRYTQRLFTCSNTTRPNL